jgi:hypothetical protein
MSRVRRAVFLCVICVVLAAQNSSSASSKSGQNVKKDKPVQASSDQFVWRVDLHPLGYPADDPMLQRRRGLLDFDTLDFLSETVEAATFITQEPAHDLRARDAANPPPYTLHAIFLDAASGKILKTLEWPVPDSNAGIFSHYDGGFLFFSTERVVLYSAGWQPVKELLLPQLREPHASLLDIAVSPSAKVIMIRLPRDRSPFCIRIVTDTLEGSEQPCGTPPRLTISDREMAASRGRNGTKEIDSNGPQFDPHNYGALRYEFAIEMRAESGELHTLCETADPSGSYCVGSQFVSDKRIVLFGEHSLALLDLAGQMIFMQKFDLDDAWIDPTGKPVHQSADGQRFAVAFNESHRKLWPAGGTVVLSASELPAEFPERIQIFDVKTNDWIYMLDNKKKQFPQIWGLALSPSGSQLAIDSGGVVQTYALPATVATPSHR